MRVGFAFPSQSTEYKMDPLDFLKTAELLLNRKEEHNTRTSISRSYYAVHLHIRDFISETALGGKRITENPHQKTIHFLQLCNVPEVKKIGHKLVTLRQARTDADYEMRKKIMPNKGQDIHEEASELLSDFKKAIDDRNIRQEFCQSTIKLAKIHKILPS